MFCSTSHLSYSGGVFVIQKIYGHMIKKIFVLEVESHSPRKSTPRVTLMRRDLETADVNFFSI
jgi:hypothetical protein